MITAQPDIVKHALEKGDEFMVIACDGIWDIMENQEAVGIQQFNARDVLQDNLLPGRGRLQP
jgi:serine/threonine protein phosphatase PrpC